MAEIWEEKLAQIDDLIQESRHIGKKAVMDVEYLRDLFSSFRESLPEEIDRAKAIVREKKKIEADAAAQAETLIQKSEQRQKAMVDQTETVRAATNQASVILTQAQNKTVLIMQDAEKRAGEALQTAKDKCQKMQEESTAKANEMLEKSKQEAADLLAEACMKSDEIKKFSYTYSLQMLQDADKEVLALASNIQETKEKFEAAEEQYNQ